METNNELGAHYDSAPYEVRFVFDDDPELANATLESLAAQTENERSDEGEITTQVYVEEGDGLYPFQENANEDDVLPLVLDSEQRSAAQEALGGGSAVVEILTPFGMADEEVWSIQTFAFHGITPDGRRTFILVARSELRPRLPEEPEPEGGPGWDDGESAPVDGVDVKAPPEPQPVFETPVYDEPPTPTGLDVSEAWDVADADADDVALTPKEEELPAEQIIVPEPVVHEPKELTLIIEQREPIVVFEPVTIQPTREEMTQPDLAIVERREPEGEIEEIVLQEAVVVEKIVAPKREIKTEQSPAPLQDTMPATEQSIAVTDEIETMAAPAEPPEEAPKVLGQHEVVRIREETVASIPEATTVDVSAERRPAAQNEQKTVQQKAPHAPRRITIETPPKTEDKKVEVVAKEEDVAEPAEVVGDESEPYREILSRPADKIVESYGRVIHLTARPGAAVELPKDRISTPSSWEKITFTEPDAAWSMRGAEYDGDDIVVSFEALRTVRPKRTARARNLTV